MAKRVFKTDLSVKGIENLKKELMNYRDVELPNKCKELVVRLADLGINVAQAKIDESPLGKYVTIRTDLKPEKAGCKAILVATGSVMESEGYAPFNTLLAIEFGAGIHYNPVPNPNSDKFGLGVGTFPGQTHAFEDFWFYWDEVDEKWKPTHGVKATMPMYYASMEITLQVVKIAKEVFGS